MLISLFWILDSYHIYPNHPNPKESPQKGLEKEITALIKTILQQAEDLIMYHPVTRHHLLGRRPSVATGKV